MKKYIFKSNVLHSAEVFSKGSECPRNLVDEFLKKELIQEVEGPKEEVQEKVQEEVKEKKSKK